MSGDSTYRTFRVSRFASTIDFQANRVVIEQGGALALYHPDGSLIVAFAPGGWVRVEMAPTQSSSRPGDPS